MPKTYVMPKMRQPSLVLHGDRLNTCRCPLYPGRRNRFIS